ncbi:MAG: DUF2807 domain-containing protein [Marinicaulis sp.]|nr:DUF2807 domain-containing protein [Marinicaulis sp.]
MGRIGRVLSTVGALLIITPAMGDDHGAKASRSLDLTGFQGVEIAGVFNLEIVVGADYSIELTGTAAELNRVEARVANGVLTLDQRKRRRSEKKKRLGHNGGVDARIELPALNTLDISGVVDGSVLGVDADVFDIDITGVGDIKLSGACRSLDATVSGVGDLDARALECGAVKVRVSGVGDATVFAANEVDARVSGMGDIDVYGEPEKIKKSDSIFAEVTIH